MIENLTAEQKIELYKQLHRELGNRKLPRVPHRFLDAIIQKHSLKCDAHLANVLDVDKPTISKVRIGKNQVSSNLILAIQRKLGMPLSEIDALLAA